jgi:hypothetical protein
MRPDSHTRVSLLEQNTLPHGVLGLGCRRPLQLGRLRSVHIGLPHYATHVGLLTCAID